MKMQARYQRRYGVYVVGGEKVFVPQVKPLTGFRESEANDICNFLTRNLGKVAVKIELESRAVYPRTLTYVVAEKIDVRSDTIFIEKGDL